MTWLKSPWFWLLALVAIVLAWLLFFRGSSKGSSLTRAPQNTGFGAPFRGLLDSIESRFSIGDSIMGGGGSG